ncbi:hypothetical protein CN918_30555 [Priestia megaterium]|nr:hypothetical protein CN918_30555 [Priestia megaterium]
MEKASRILKWVAGGLEALWGFPFLGGTLVIGMAYSPLVLMMAVHIVGLVFAIKTNKVRTGNIMGIICSAIAWIPFVGMIMHILTAVFLFIEAAKAKESLEETV